MTSNCANPSETSTAAANEIVGRHLRERVLEPLQENDDFSFLTVSEAPYAFLIQSPVQLLSQLGVLDRRIPEK